jgi:hygromycin-B 4-O-kinase
MTPHPDDDEARLRTLLGEHVAGEVADLERLKGGVFSRAYGFRAGGQALVVRLSSAPHAAEAFAKDDYAARHFATPSLPIPRILARGPHYDGHFAISERVPGRTLEELPPAERLAVLPAKLDTLDAIMRADLRGSRGYGAWDGTGAGMFATWRDALAAIIDNETEGFYRDWHALFRDSFLERGVFESPRSIHSAIEDGGRTHSIQLTDPIRDANLQTLVSQLTTISNPSKK